MALTYHNRATRTTVNRILSYIYKNCKSYIVLFFGSNRKNTHPIADNERMSILEVPFTLPLERQDNRNIL
jgi:uracil DNA glycosylase